MDLGSLFGGPCRKKSKKKSWYYLDFRSESEQDPDPNPLFHETDPDPYQNETDPQHCFFCVCLFVNRKQRRRDSAAQLNINIHFRIEIMKIDS